MLRRSVLMWLTIFSLAGIVSLAGTSPPSPLRIAVFAESDFPAADAPATDPNLVREALAGCEVAVLDSAGLTERLNADRFDALVLPFGAAFPVQAWPAIQRYLEQGGNWVNLGGVPFAVPVERTTSGWRVQSRRTAYHKFLGITQAFPVETKDLTFETADGAPEEADGLAGGYRPGTVFEFLIRLAEKKRHPDEDGSDGPPTGRVTPFVHAKDSDGLALAAPVIVIDRLEGRFGGGRWVLVSGNLGLPGDILRHLVFYAARGPQHLSVQPRYAGFHFDEPLAVEISFRRPHRVAAEVIAGPCRVAYRNTAGTTVWKGTVALRGEGENLTGSLDGPRPAEKGLKPGLYQIVAELPVTAPGRQPTTTLRAESGFLVYEPDMVKGGKGLTAGGDYFLRDGKLFPVSGSTYMASDVHRRFLLQPNPWLWEKDFAAMRAAGVNLVRTGIWTGWKEHSDGEGRPQESVLRALEVFLLTARAHDIPVIFTLFAFVPETWGGVNPYLSPASLAAQQRFVGGFASRLAGAEDLIWDLINEPSFSSPEHLWQTRPQGDPDEAAAWSRWLKEKAAQQNAMRPDLTLADRWGGMAGEGEGLPSLDDFTDRRLLGPARPNKAADYRRFAQDSFAHWVRQISASLRQSGHSRPMITVGQDEGGTIDRPSPMFFGPSVDFTTNHTWWFDDALLWDGLMTKLPGRPNLIEETGVMGCERLDGTAWRDEKGAGRLLEQKLALAVGAGAAGFVQWAWNINPYMPSDNEAGIGFFRADGTARPELDPFSGLARFLAGHRALFTGREMENAVVVVPHSEIFSVRGNGTAATQRAVRTMEYELGIPVRMVAEHALREELSGARLILLPAPRIIQQEAWDALLAAVDRGAVLVVTGPLDRDEYERPVERSAALGLTAATLPVAPAEDLFIEGQRYRMRFGGDKLARIEKAVVAAEDQTTVPVLPYGKGTLLWSPIPVELADESTATTALYRMASRYADLGASISVGHGRDPAVLVRPIMFEKAILITLVNETDTRRQMDLQITASAPMVGVELPGRSAALIFLDRATGALLGRYPEGPEP